MSRGTLDATLVHPREVFKAALLANAAAVILFHNHPSGDPTPSADDVQLTRRLVDAGTLLVSRHRGSRHNFRAGHPGWLRCSSLTYSRDARSSRLAIRAPRSGTYATIHGDGTLGVDVLDHIIIGDGRYVSFGELGTL